MYHHNITLALAEARVADLQRAATHSTATAPPRRHLRALALLGLSATAALATTGALAQAPAPGQACSSTPGSSYTRPTRLAPAADTQRGRRHRCSSSPTRCGEIASYARVGQAPGAR
jgi:hypothetical protein